MVDFVIVENMKFHICGYTSEGVRMVTSVYCEILNPMSISKFIGLGVKLGCHPTRELKTHTSSARDKQSLERYSCMTCMNVNVHRQLQIQNENQWATTEWHYRGL